MSEYFEIVDPSAESVVESLRAIGYQPETAIADLIDNSLAAKARTIKIDFQWNGYDSYVRIEDDGLGMTEAELRLAMKLGSKDPLDAREKIDLGRFGLGLKTASFSQARRLTVQSKAKRECQFTRCWDLDYIRDQKKWALLKHPFDHTSESRLGSISSSDTGTIVLWEKLDRFFEKKLNDKSYHMFLRRVEKVEKHIAMVFHKYLSRPNPVKIFINGNLIRPWDPFLTKEWHTQELSPASYQDEDQLITIQPYVLPHHSKISREMYNYAEGPKGWSDQQGFYVYRNQRLLVAGSWFGMFRKEESCKLARIMVDITSNSDFSWNIDVKKSFARPPESLMPVLKRIGQTARERSQKVYYHRGTKILSDATQQKTAVVWEQVRRHGQTFFQINRQHPLLTSLVQQDKVDKQLLNAFLSLVEDTIPYQFMAFNSLAEGTKTISTFDIEEQRIEDTRKLLHNLINTLKEAGRNVEEIKRLVSTMDPFVNYPELLSEL